MSSKAKPPGSRSTKEKTTKIDQAAKKFFGPLNLEQIDLSVLGKKTRPRNHVNPLGRQFLQPPAFDMTTLFPDPSKELVLDIGCAQGRFGLLQAKEQPEFNHMGLEIRGPHVDRANVWAKELGLTNLKYVVGSANQHMHFIGSSYPGKLRMVAVQFPDPHFKRKHHKRRVINTAFLLALAQVLPKDSVLFLQSDVEEAAAQMRDRALKSGFFSRRPGDVYSPRSADIFTIAEEGTQNEESHWTRDGKRAKEGGEDYGDWLQGPNPLGAKFKTEREVQNEALGLPIYRCILVRNDKVAEEEK